MAVSELKSDLKLTTDTPYFALMGKLWGFSERIWEKLDCIITALQSIFSCFLSKQFSMHRVKRSRRQANFFLTNSLTKYMTNWRWQEPCKTCLKEPTKTILTCTTEPVFLPLNHTQIVWWPQAPSKMASRQTCAVYSSCLLTVLLHQNLLIWHHPIPIIIHWRLEREAARENGLIYWWG